ncbi:MAG: small ribosomal subunit biogenesis GTPase RsgA [Oceanospirillales bacterium]|uniref:Small ribosomal subunit biogenesis GTPase RsgA n=1 Tax=Marinobacterium halophilum TaxID=267374 RepID=A0A2P8F3M3_9GAMM|nr:small ribosomal subunit biogenesis GTPase RsgA [Marinobacterium halophilum]MBR9830037.1 small ribosomal subunit biogenesis GTPase RsgA [Oceanospirillales bacterium]PSL16324.1 ribosome biogenesis GTPase [Marinobacterium halophilum]
MGKRKVNRRQAWRISKIQEERTARAQRRDTLVEDQLEGGDLGPEQQGLIISHFGRQVDVEVLEGEHKGDIQRCHMRTHLGQLVTGDRVVWRRSADSGVVVATLDRHSELMRPNNHGELKPVAANIDYIVIVIAVEPHAHANLIDRYLVAAEASDIEPVLLLNKADLLTAENRERLEPLLEQYRELGYRTLQASTASSHGLDELKALLADHISVFVGQSGVGKSSLINSLLPGSDLKVGALSEQSRKGKHTTTTARLFHFPDGGDLIDSPGIREFALWHMTEEQVLDGFRELAALRGYCRFRDCRHEQEPGCAFLQALENGDISIPRFNSYLQILNSMQDNR